MGRPPPPNLAFLRRKSAAPATTFTQNRSGAGWREAVAGADDGLGAGPHHRGVVQLRAVEPVEPLPLARRRVERSVRGPSTSRVPDQASIRSPVHTADCPPLHSHDGGGRNGAGGSSARCRCRRVVGRGLVLLTCRPGTHPQTTIRRRSRPRCGGRSRGPASATPPSTGLRIERGPAGVRVVRARADRPTR